MNPTLIDALGFLYVIGLLFAFPIAVGVYFLFKLVQQLLVHGSLPEVPVSEDQKKAA